MITFERAKEIFSDSEVFNGIRHFRNKPNRVEMKNLSKSGEHYCFLFRQRPNGFNNVAEIGLSKWEPLRAYVVCHDIVDEEFLLKLIELCKSGEI